MEIKTSAGHFLMATGVIGMAASIGVLTEHNTFLEAWRFVGGAVSALVFIYVTRG